jgi:hypothetical protein
MDGSDQDRGPRGQLTTNSVSRAASQRDEGDAGGIGHLERCRRGSWGCDVWLRGAVLDLRRLGFVLLIFRGPSSYYYYGGVLWALWRVAVSFRFLPRITTLQIRMYYNGLFTN